MLPPRVEAQQALPDVDEPAEEEHDGNDPEPPRQVTTDEQDDGHDGRRLGHRARDVVWVQALNLVLIPVNLAGVLKSLHQAMTGRKIPFARTPKIADRVAAPPVFILTPYLLVLGLAGLAVLAATRDYWIGVGFAAGTSLLVLVGAFTFVGVRTALEDVRRAAVERMRRPLRVRP